MTASDRPVALVTGSATGVGRACALRYAAAGYDVVINYTRSEKEAARTASDAEQAGASTLVVRCDVSDDEAVRSMIAGIAERFGRLDRLVNNAACTYFIEHANLEELTGEKWDRILSVNVKGAYFVTRAAVPMLRKAKGAAVVNISSVAGVSGLGSSIAYCASKGALNTMTKSLARVLAPEIRVNAVCPGPIDTRWLREWKSPGEIEEMTSTYPIPRAAVPDDVADIVMFLSDGTNLTTGQCLVVDGGRTI